MLAELAVAASTEVAEVFNPSGRGGFVLVCEHASNYIPPSLNNLGLAGDVLHSHIAWDIGALAVAQEMSRNLDSPLVAQRVSRLVCDCNRPPLTDDATPPVSEIYPIPGNTDISQAERQRRARLFYEPFCSALKGTIERCLQQGDWPVILTVHSFSPVYKQVRRNLDVGLIDDGGADFAAAMFDCLQDTGEAVVRRNAPYCRQDGVTHTLSLHAVERGLLNVMLEIRNDLIGEAAGQQKMAALLAACAQKARMFFTTAAPPDGSG